MRGRLFAGTSGFAYPGWSPRFYPPGLHADERLRHYAARLPAVELNGTFYRQPRPAQVDAWLAATPPDFRFVVKAQRGGSARAFADPAAGLGWLTDPYRRFGARLGAVLFRLPDGTGRDDARLERLLRAWPGDLPLVLDARDPSWQVDATAAALAAHGAAWCATEGPDDADPPDLRTTGGLLYLRLRRHDYDDAELASWWRRIDPVLAAGRDVYAFFRHDEVGRGAELATALAALEAAGGRDPSG